MRVTLTRLLREVKPDRLLIEPTGLGHPAGIIDTLRDEWLAQALDLRATICLVDPRQLADPRYAETPAYQDQINLADVLVANKTDLASPQQLQAFFAYAAQLYPPKVLVAETQHGRLDPAWLDVDPRHDRVAAFPDAHRDHTAAAAMHLVQHGIAGRRESAGLGNVSCGWLFPPETVFRQERLQALFAGFDRLAGLRRAKGVFRIGREWILANWTTDGAEFRPIAYRRDSRVELLAAEGAVPDWDEVEALLMGAVKGE
jgi:G3E family GTPase